MKIRNSDEVVVQSIKNYIGIGNFKVVGINSSLSELEELGFNYKQEPNYSVELNGVMYSKLIFYVVNTALDIKTKLEFLLNGEEEVFQTGNKKFVNDLAQSSIGDSLETCLSRTNKSGVNFFKNVNARPAKKGEVELLEFLVAWFNIKNFVSAKEAKDGIEPDLVVVDFNKLIRKDLSEIKAYWQQAKDNEVKLLLTVNNNYMNVYNRYFDRATANLTNFQRYIKNQEDAGYPPKGDYLIGDLVEYTPRAVSSSPTPDEEIPAPAF